MSLEMYNLQQAGIITGLAESDLRLMIREGKLRAWSLPGQRGLLIRKDDLAGLRMKRLTEIADVICPPGTAPLKRIAPALATYRVRALTLHQPWASLMAHGFKRNETRSRRLHYRGPLVIAAAAALPVYAADWLNSSREGRRASQLLQSVGHPTAQSLPYGAAICIVNFRDCIPTHLDDDYQLEGDERIFGNYSAGRYVMVTTDLQRFSEPIRVRGSQGLWTYTGPLPGVDLAPYNL